MTNKINNNDFAFDWQKLETYLNLTDIFGLHTNQLMLYQKFSTGDFANFMKISSIVLSTALNAPGIRDRFTAKPPFLKLFCYRMRCIDIFQK